MCGVGGTVLSLVGDGRRGIGYESGGGRSGLTGTS